MNPRRKVKPRRPVAGPRRSASGLPRWGARLALAVGALVAALLVAEGVARLDGLAPPASVAAGLDPTTAGCASLSPTRGWWIAGRCGRDADGFYTPRGRGAEGALRVLLVGDSVGAQTWPTWAAQALEDRLGRPVELLNASVPGYDTCQEAAVLREGIAAAAPHVVLLQTCANDTTFTPVVLSGEGPWLLVLRDGAWIRVPRFLAASRLVQRLVFSQAWAGARQPNPGDGVQAAGACAREAVATANDAEVPLYVLHVPVLADPSEDLPGPTGSTVADHFRRADEVRAAWAAAGAQTLDLREPLAALGPWSTLRFSASDTLHFAHLRNQEVGEAVAALLAPALAPYSSR